MSTLAMVCLVAVPARGVLWASCLAGVAVLLAWPHPPGQWRRGPAVGSWQVPEVLRPRPDAPSLVVRAGLGVLLGCGAVSVVPGVGGLLLAVIFGVGVAVVVGRLEPRGGRARRARVTVELPETLDLLAACLEAGAPLRSAVRQVAAVAPAGTRPALEAVAARIGVGISDADAWRSLADDPAWSEVAKDLARSAETGSASAQVLRDHAADARAARREEQVKRARAVGVRSVLPLMCCFLPAFMLTGVVPIVASMLGTILHR